MQVPARPHLVLLFLAGWAAASSCTESSATSSSGQMTDHDLGVVTRVDSYSVDLVATNTTNETWNFERATSSCGCIEVGEYAKNVAPGSDARLTVTVHPIDRFGRQEQVVRLMRENGGFIGWHVHGVFAARPFFRNQHHEVALSSTSTSYAVDMSLLALASAGEPEVTATEMFGHAPSVTVDTASTDDSGLVNYRVHLRGTCLPNATVGSCNVQAAFPHVAETATTTVECRRRSRVLVSPAIVLLPTNLESAEWKVSYSTEIGTSVASCELSETLRESLKAELHQDNVSLKQTKTIAAGTQGTLTLVFSDGGRHDVPVAAANYDKD